MDLAESKNLLGYLVGAGRVKTAFLYLMHYNLRRIKSSEMTFSVVVSFATGNAQGRYQKPNALPRQERPFLLQPLWNGAPFTINIPRSTELLFHSK